MKRTRTMHGLTNTPEYEIWLSLRQRCLNPRSKDFKNYGARGIAVCERWNNFEIFLSDMGRRPSSDYSIERIDNFGNYEPTNCKWATRVEQHNNTRVNRMIEIGGIKKTVTQWAREVGIKQSTIYQRLYHGWKPERAVNTQVNHAAI